MAIRNPPRGVALALVGLLSVPAAAGTSRLYSLLAPAPTPDWGEVQPTPTTLDGPFTTQSYDNYLRTVSPSTPSVEPQLKALAFRQGYARMWVRGSSQDVLSERVFQFGDPLGAAAWYASLKAQNQFTKYMVRAIPPLPGHPDSFGVVLKTPDHLSYRVEFVVANLVFTVHSDSAQNDLTQLAVSQALTELQNQPAGPSPAKAAAAAQPARPRLPLGELAVIAVVVVAAGATGTAAFVYKLSRRGR